MPASILRSGQIGLRRPAFAAERRVERTGNCPGGIVYIVDDDDLVRRSLEAVLTLEGLKTAAFSKAGDLLKCVPEDGIGCVVTDVRMPEMDGLELQEEIIRRDLVLSVIVVTGYADVPLAVRATLPSISRSKQVEPVCWPPPIRKHR